MGGGGVKYDEMKFDTFKNKNRRKKLTKDMFCFPGVLC